jgi:hypothetical protein
MKGNNNNRSKKYSGGTDEVKLTSEQRLAAMGKKRAKPNAWGGGYKPSSQIKKGTSNPLNAGNTYVDPEVDTKDLSSYISRTSSAPAISQHRSNKYKFENGGTINKFNMKEKIKSIFSKKKDTSNVNVSDYVGEERASSFGDSPKIKIKGDRIKIKGNGTKFKGKVKEEPKPATKRTELNSDMKPGVKSNSHKAEMNDDYTGPRDKPKAVKKKAPKTDLNNVKVTLDDLNSAYTKTKTISPGPTPNRIYSGGSKKPVKKSSNGDLGAAYKRTSGNNTSPTANRSYGKSSTATKPNNNPKTPIGYAHNAGKIDASDHYMYEKDEHGHTRLKSDYKRGANGELARTHSSGGKKAWDRDKKAWEAAKRKKIDANLDAYYSKEAKRRKNVKYDTKGPND